MVTMAQLRDVNLTSWRDAARGWLTLSQHTRQAALDIRDQGAGPVSDAWRDEVGQTAYEVLNKLAIEYDMAADVVKGAQLVLDGLADAVEIAQRELTSALSLVARPISVTEDGTVHVDLAMTLAPAEVEQVTKRAATIEKMICDAVEAASQADQTAAQALDKLRHGTELAITGDRDHDIDQALALQEDASLAQVNALHFTLPHGQGPDVVAAWWNGLTERERQELQLALPTELCDLDGIPDTVKADLRGHDGYDRMAVVKYALDHVEDTSIDKWPSNCTQFVSTALSAGGIPAAGPYPLLGPQWHDGGDWPFTNPSRAWVNSQASHDFMLDHGGTEVPRGEAKPGDVIYFRNGKGEVYHAAMVTAVTPDGDIKYTQHTPGRTDSTLDGRASSIRDDQGSNDIAIVRVKPDWAAS
ncbi:amidase domain-containing protein [Kutzneria albida]|uniref:Putative amidase domain-containing protein n=1 Tax=Kutzneria albida DSM 43870 TaxID=1449976 RepID=W5WGU2_9PSEU|nr:amidase domain-containing protein [Kutzneria albida]AHH97384.1 hypothetical protein KALB_4020 [Kutzneria albida DSM 43870]